MSDTKRNYLLLALLIIIWGSSFLLTDRSLLFFSPEQVVTYRLTIGAITMLLISVIYSKTLFLTFRPWLHFSIYAVVGNILPYLLISIGQTTITSGMAGLLMAFMPLVTLILAHFFLPNDKLNIFKVLGFIVGIFWLTYLSQIGILSYIDTFGAFFGPLFGVMIFDFYFIKKGNLINKDIYSLESTGTYYYSGGWHIKGVYSLILGFIFSSATIWNSNLMFLHSFSWIIGAFVAGFVYYLLAKE